MSEEQKPRQEAHVKAYAAMESTAASFKALAMAAGIFNTCGGKSLRKALGKLNKRPSRKVWKVQKMALRKALKAA